MVKRVMAAAAAAMMTVTCLAGCGGGKQAKDADEKIKIFSGYLGNMTVGDDNSPIYKTLHEKLGIEIEPMSSNTNSNDAATKLNVLLASGEVPDIFVSSGVDINNRQYTQWIKEGIVLPLSDYSKDYPNIDNKLKQFDDLKALEEGKHYFLPIYSYEGNNETVGSSCTWIRKDWLKKLNLEMPKTTEDFIKVATAFAQNDPDGNGQNDTTGYSFSKVYGFPYDLFDTRYNRFKKVDGKWEPEIVSDNMKEALKAFQKMYNSGAVDREFVIGPSCEDKFISGKAGMIGGKGMWYDDMYEKFKAAYPDKNPEDMFCIMDDITNTSGYVRGNGQDNYYLMTAVSGVSSEAKQKKSMKLLDYLLSDEGLKLMRYGVEGVDYEEKDGKITRTVPNDEKTGRQKKMAAVDSVAALKSLVTWDSLFMYDDEPFKERRLEYSKHAIERDSKFPNPLRYLKLDEEKISNVKKKELETYFFETATNMIINNEDIDSGFEKMKQEWYKRGGTAYVEEINAKAKEAGL